MPAIPLALAMTDSEQTAIPEKLPLLWRLMFAIFVASGLFTLLGIIGEQDLWQLIDGVLSAGVLMAAGLLGLRRRPAAIYLSLLILVGSAIRLDIPLLFQNDYVATQVQQAYDEINAVAATTLVPDDELVSQIEMLYRTTAVAISVLHAWMSLYVWRRRHWFA